MTKPQTRIESVMSTVQSKITSRDYLPGSRLPSVRAQAKTLKVSVSTVVEAYERLAAEGKILSRPGSGFYVAGHVAPLALAQIGPKLDREIDPLWISRQSLERDPDALKPGCGWLPEEWLFEEGIRRALRSVARLPALELSEYAPSLGHFGFRQFIQRRLVGHSIEADLRQIMVTNSGTQSIDLICRMLLKQGDTVLVDDPCYFNFHALLKAHQVQVIGVPYLENGPDLAEFEKSIQAHSPRLYLTNSGVHNPTGATLSPVVAHKLLKLADQYDLAIVEDDIFADFEMVAAPRLASFDGLNRVIQIGSFSKTVSASVRCGFIAARPDWIEKLVDLHIATSFGGGRLAAELVLQALTDPGYRKHMEKARLWLEEQRIKISSQLKQIGIQPWLMPQAGMFLWCRLPDGIDATELARKCLQKGVILAPGNAFSQALNAHDYVRFNVSQCQDPKLFLILRSVLSELSKQKTVARA